MMKKLALFFVLLLTASNLAQDLTPKRAIELVALDEASLKRSNRIPLSQEKLQRFAEFYQNWATRIEQIDFESLEQPAKVDYLLLANFLNRKSFQLKQQSQREAEVLKLAPIHSVIKLLDHRRQRKEMDSEKTAETVDTTIQQFDTFISEIKSGKRTSDRIIANRSFRKLNDVRYELQQWYRYYHSYDPIFTWWMEKPYKALDAKVYELASAIRKEIAGIAPEDKKTVVGDPIGRDALVRALQAEFIAYSPEELIRIAEREFEWCRKEYELAAKEMKAKDWRDALGRVKKLHVKPGKQPALIRQLADEAVEFLEKRDLVTIPRVCKETWRMEMMTARRQKVNPYFTGGEVISVSFPTQEMDYRDKLMSLRGNNIHFSRATVHHELIPGHHLQIFMADRFRAHRKLFRTPFFVEGWALYWEMLLWDLDFQRSPEDRIGMLFWRSHRCARIIFSLNYHLGRMTEQECVDYLVANVGHEPRNAEAEVRRSVEGLYEPLYQAAYMLGGLQLRALRKETVESGKMTDKQFHDALLRENSIPIEFIRAQLLGLPLKKDHTSKWRF